MKAVGIFFFIFAFFINSTLCVSSTIKDPKKESAQWIKQADQLIEFHKMGLYYLAIDLYVRALQNDSDNTVLNFKLGKAYLFSEEKTNALPFLLKAYRQDCNVSFEIELLLGRAYQYKLNLDSAMYFFKAFSNKSFNKKNQELQLLALKRIDECEFAKKMMAKPYVGELKNLGLNVNTSFAEYNPQVSEDGNTLFFTARNDATTGNKKDPYDLMYFEDAYISNKIEGKWSTAVNLKNVNTEKNDAIAGIKQNGSKVFIYRDMHGGDVYQSDYVNGNWTEPQRLSKNINSHHHEGSVSLSPDGKTMYFISDRDGGFGKSDIYCTHLDSSGTWGKAENLGKLINTPEDEESVYLHSDGKTLFFSSNGHQGMGGFDIFRSSFENGAWSVPENLGYPINTADDELYFSLTAEGRNAYFSSDNYGRYGAQDIFEFEFDPFHTPITKFHQKVNLLGKVRNKNDQKGLTTTLEIFENSLHAPVFSGLTNEKGEFSLYLDADKDYTALFKMNGFIIHSEKINANELFGGQNRTREISIEIETNPGKSSCYELVNILSVNVLDEMDIINSLANQSTTPEDIFLAVMNEVNKSPKILNAKGMEISNDVIEKSIRNSIKRLTEK